MLKIDDESFEKILAAALDNLPQDKVAGLVNVAITYEDNPTPVQLSELRLRNNQTLYGLYQGIPLTSRAAATSMLSGNPMTMPDKITIFKQPIANDSDTLDELKEKVRHTLWHEIAHYYGLNHDQIEKLE